MFSKLLSKAKITPASAQDPTEAAALDSISALEKAEALQATLAAARDAAFPTSNRHALLRRQCEQAALAVRKHQIERERARVADVMQRDKTLYEGILKRAEDGLDKAVGELKTRQERHRGIVERLKPLEAALTQITADAAAREKAARQAFDAAMTNGDEAAQTAAAEALFHAARERAGGNDDKGGPLSLRLAVIRREEIDANRAVAAATQALQAAEADVLKARSELAMLEYDRQAQALLEAYIVQRNAEAACRRAGAAGRMTEAPDIQVGSVDRIMFGKKIDAYNNRRLPQYVMADLVKDSASTPDLAVLAADVNEIAEDPVELAPDVSMWDANSETIRSTQWQAPTEQPMPTDDNGRPMVRRVAPQ